MTLRLSAPSGAGEFASREAARRSDGGADAAVANWCTAGGASLGESAQAADREAMRAALGLDRPLLERWAGFYADLARGDLGDSLVRDAWAAFGRRLNITVNERKVRARRFAGAASTVASAKGVRVHFSQIWGLDGARPASNIV